MIGQTLSHYKIIEKLGQGGMGEVYLAEDTKLDRKVALKFLPTEVEADADARERLIREAKAASRLSHPNILTIYSVEEVDGRHFIVMEYIQGATLGQFVKERAPKLDEILGLAIPMAEGLARAHESGLVHRDLKPSNVLVENDGRPRILDFGLAKIEGAAKLTKTGSTVGTVAYSSPELAQGREADSRSDIFSLGVVLYEMITGRLPFEGEHEATLVYSIVHEEPQPLARYRSGVPAGLQQVITKCLSKSADERYQSAAELVADLKREKRQLDSGEASAVTPAPAPASPGGSKVAWFVAAAAVLITVSVFLIEPWIEDKGTSTSPDSAPTLAVLPFLNQGQVDDEYFADGITDEITTHLAKIQGLRVISRASAMQYKSSELSVAEIADQLGVNYVLMGTISWDKTSSANRVRISPELTHAVDGFRVWGDSYDRTLTQIFDVQSEIAEQIATALGISLLRTQKDQLAYQPTENLLAYDYYLRARDKLNRGTEVTHLRSAIHLLHQAIDEDPDFTVAYATLAQTHTLLYWWHRNPQELDSAQQIFDMILKQDQMLPELQLVLGTYYTLVETSYERAAVAFDNARMALGESSDLYQQTAYLAKRQGDWRKAVAHAQIALDLDPRSVAKCIDLSDTYEALREYELADRLLDRANSMGPPTPENYHLKARLPIFASGDVDSARRVVKEATKFMDPAEVMTLQGAGNVWLLGLWRFDLLNEDEAVDPARVEYLRDAPKLYVYYLTRSEMARIQGQKEMSHTFLDTAISIMDSLSESHGDDFHFIQEWALINSLRGNHEIAIEAGLRAKEVMPVDLCHW